MKRNNLLLLAVFLAFACKKYPDASQLGGASYLRVYNDIFASVDALDYERQASYLTFFMDPVPDSAPVFSSAAIVGDYLASRQIYSTSYPINAGNSNLSGGLGYPQNFDYPGNLHVLTAPPINGFNLSAWAQITSGNHHFVFYKRPFSSTAFLSLPASSRQSPLIDTTVTFLPGEVYTLEVVTLDQTKGKFGLYVRQEDFIHSRFQDDQLYVSIYNLSGKYDQVAAQQLGTPQNGYLFDTLTLNYSYSYTQALSGSNSLQPVANYSNQFYGYLVEHFAKKSNYLTFPLLPANNFVDSLGRLRHYYVLNSTILPGTLDSNLLPYVELNLNPLHGERPGGGGGGGSVYASGDPVTINQIDARVPFTLAGQGFDVPVANFSSISNVGGQLVVTPTLNIIELVYNRAYQIQIVRQSNAIVN